MTDTTPHGADRDNSAPYQRTNDTQRGVQRSKATRRIVFGAIWLVVGLLITIVTSSHPFYGGHYIIAYGPMIYGTGLIAWGLWSKTRID